MVDAGAAIIMGLLIFNSCCRSLSAVEFNDVTESGKTVINLYIYLSRVSIGKIIQNT